MNCKTCPQNLREVFSLEGNINKKHRNMGQSERDAYQSVITVKRLFVVLSKLQTLTKVVSVTKQWQMPVANTADTNWCTIPGAQSCTFSVLCKSNGSPPDLKTVHCCLLRIQCLLGHGLRRNTRVRAGGHSIKCHQQLLQWPVSSCQSLGA